jgi:hypothetical protein
LSEQPTRYLGLLAKAVYGGNGRVSEQADPNFDGKFSQHLLVSAGSFNVAETHRVLPHPEAIVIFG